MQIDHRLNEILFPRLDDRRPFVKTRIFGEQENRESCQSVTCAARLWGIHSVIKFLEHGMHIMSATFLHLSIGTFEEGEGREGGERTDSGGIVRRKRFSCSPGEAISCPDRAHSVRWL